MRKKNPKPTVGKNLRTSQIYTNSGIDGRNFWNRWWRGVVMRTSGGSLMKQVGVEVTA